MNSIELAEKIEQIQITLHESIDLSIANEDAIIHRNKIGLNSEHLITLAQTITEKLREIQKDFENLISRIQ